MATTTSLKDLDKYREAAPSQQAPSGGSKPHDKKYHGDSRPSGNPHQGQNPQGGKGLPKEYLQNGYFEGKHLKREYIVEYASDIANQLAYDPQKQMTAAGLRRFFAKVRFLERKLNNAKGDFAVIVPEILALIPYVHNAKTRGVVPQLFQEFIEKNVNVAAKDKDAFCKGFLKHFEYVVAFFPKNK